MALKPPADLVLHYGDRQYRMPYWDLIPPSPQEKVDELTESIKTVGVQLDVLVNATNVEGVYDVIDGHTRLLIAHGLGIPAAGVPVKILELTYDAAETMAVTTNLLRRQIDGDGRHAIVLDLRRRGWSYRRINSATGVGINQIMKVLAGLAEEEKPKTVTATDGKVYGTEAPPEKRRSPGRPRKAKPQEEADAAVIEAGPVETDHTVVEEAPAETEESKAVQVEAARKLSKELVGKLCRSLQRAGLYTQVKDSLQAISDAIGA